MNKAIIFYQVGCQLYLIIHLHMLIPIILIYQINNFSPEKFIISKYSSILNDLLHSESHVLEFHI